MCVHRIAFGERLRSSAILLVVVDFKYVKQIRRHRNIAKDVLSFDECGAVDDCCLTFD